MTKGAKLILAGGAILFFYKRGNATAGSWLAKAWDGARSTVSGAVGDSDKGQSLISDFFGPPASVIASSPPGAGTPGVSLLQGGGATSYAINANTDGTGQVQTDFWTGRDIFG